jgi:predicted amidohydrolase YtcJ
MRGCAPALLLCLLVSGCGASEPPADLIVRGADVRTAADSARANAFAVRDGRFVAVGDDRDVEPFRGPDTLVIEGGGRSVLPGLIDAHVHFGSGIPLLRGVNLYGIPSREEWLRRVAERAAELPEGTWILGGRWDHTLVEGGLLPTRTDLDAVAPRHPVALADVDGHSTWANSLALELAGITADTPDPEGGRILHDDSGEPTGILLEAGWLVTRHVPELEPAERLDALHDTLRFATSVGITTAHDMASASRLDDYVTLLEQDRLPLRIWFGTYGGPEDVDYLAARREQVAAAVADLTTPQQGLRLQHGYVKLGIDGVLSTRTAALLEPYADDRTTSGLPTLEQEALDELVAAYNEAGFPVAIHAIGDRGVRMSLDAFERSQARHTPPLPNRIEHDEVVSPDDAGRFAELGVVASMTPHHCISGIDKYNTARLGLERAAWSFPWGRLRDRGATLVFGSDWATAPLAPLEHLYAATLREKPGGGPPGGWHPDNRLTWEEALRAYTIGPARIIGRGDEIGSIEVGKLADFVLLNAPVPDPVDRSLLELTVAETWIGGERVYAREE